MPYGVVPNSYTEMDQLKISGQLTEDTRAYAFLMAGHTVDQEIDMTRWFNDVDVRLTNTSINNTDAHRLRQDLQRSRADTGRGDGDGRQPCRAVNESRTRPAPPGGCRTRPSDRLSQVHGRLERRVAAPGRRLRPGRAGDHRRLRVRRSGADQRDLHVSDRLGHAQA